MEVNYHEDVPCVARGTVGFLDLLLVISLILAYYFLSHYDSAAG